MIHKPRVESMNDPNRPPRVYRMRCPHCGQHSPWTASKETAELAQRAHVAETQWPGVGS